jgi:hypothetical protein
MSATEEPGAEAPESSPFTQANLVGLFLTLSLCLLTQPWGSLLYRPLSRSWPLITQFCFFLWRLNPIACVAEAVVIAICLVDTIHSVWRRDRFSLSSHAHELHITAATLLIFRTSEHDGLDLQRVLSRPLDITGNGSARTLSRLDLLLSEAGLPGFGSGGASSAGNGRPTDGATSSPTTTEAQAGSSSEAQQQAEPAVELSSSLGPAVMARKERWVDLMASVSILIVMVKLAASSLPWSISVVAAWFMVTGWVAVQALLYLVHLRELDDSAARAITLREGRVRQLMGHSVTACLVHLAVLPPLVYLGYVAGFAMSLCAPPEGSCYPLSTLASIPFHGVLSDDCRNTSWITDLLYTPLVLFPLLFLVAAHLPLCAPVAIALIFGFWLREGRGACSGVFFSLSLAIPLWAGEIYFFAFTGDTGVNWYIFLVHLNSMALLVAMFYFSFRTSWKGSASEGSFAICFSTIAWAPVILGVIRRYDEGGTFKPEWLEYLG